MAIYKTKELSKQLEQEVKDMLQRADELAALGDGLLNEPPALGGWSVAQVIEHLNSYNRYYLPEIEKALTMGRAKGVPANNYFRPGFLGDYFTNMMQPARNGVIAKKYKAPKDHTPGIKLDSRTVINEFKVGQNRILDFLQQSTHTDIGRLKVPISISRFIKLKLGDTFRFLVGHQRRHFIQIERTLKNSPVSG